MVTQVNAHPGVWLDGVAVAAADFRLELGSAGLTASAAAGTTGIAATQGVRQGVGSPLLCTWTSGMSFTLNAGSCYVQGTASVTAGMYIATLDTTTTLTCTTSDPTNPRIDSVIAVISDVGSSSSTTVFKILAGTPAPSPVAPTLPANSLLLATIAVGADVSTLAANKLTDQRVYTVALGGMLPYGNVAGAAIAGPQGSPVLDMATGRWKSLDGSNNARQPKIAAFAATSNGPGAGFLTTTSGYTNAITASVTTDGVTEIEVYGTWASLNPPAGVAVGDYINIGILMDGFGIPGNASAYVRADSTSLNPFGGGSVRGWVTPSAGTHTLALAAESVGHAFTINSPFIRAAPSMQQ